MDSVFCRLHDCLVKQWGTFNSWLISHAAVKSSISYSPCGSNKPWTRPTRPTANIWTHTTVAMENLISVAVPWCWHATIYVLMVSLCPGCHLTSWQLALWQKQCSSMCFIAMGCWRKIWHTEYHSLLYRCCKPWRGSALYDITIQGIK